MAKNTDSQLGPHNHGLLRNGACLPGCLAGSGIVSWAPCPGTCRGPIWASLVPRGSELVGFPGAAQCEASALVPQDRWRECGPSRFTRAQSRVSGEGGVLRSPET